MQSLIDSVRRTTITTYNIEASLGFYRDILQMVIWYDGVFDDPQVREVYDVPDYVQTRVCILKPLEDTSDTSTQDLVTGMVGLMYFDGLDEMPIPEPVKRPVAGEVILMFTTTRMRELQARLKQGGFSTDEPIKLDTPGRHVVYELLCRDPNGLRIAFAQQSEIGPKL